MMQGYQLFLVDGNKSIVLAARNNWLKRILYAVGAPKSWTRKV